MTRFDNREFSLNIKGKKWQRNSFFVRLENAQTQKNDIKFRAIKKIFSNYDLNKTNLSSLLEQRLHYSILILL